MAIATSGMDATQEKVMSVVCCRGKGNGRAASGKSRYGSAGGGKYDESDEEDVKGILYNNNLLLDDDDDEEEQIVILTKEKPAKTEQRSQPAPVQEKVDHSVFTEGSGLLDMAAASTSAAPSQPSSYDQIMNRMHQEEKHE